MTTKTMARCESGKCGVASHVVGTAAYKDCTRLARREQDRADRHVISAPPKLAVSSLTDADSQYPVDLSKVGAARAVVEANLDQEYEDGLTRAEYIVTHGGISRVKYADRERGSGRAFRAYFADPEDGAEYMEFERDEEFIVGLFDAEDTTSPDKKLMLDYEKKAQDTKEAFEHMKWVRKNRQEESEIAQQEYREAKKESDEAGRAYVKYTEENPI